MTPFANRGDEDAEEAEDAKSSCVERSSVFSAILRGLCVLDRDKLSRIHPVVGVQRALEGAHDLERGSVLGLEILHLADADAVLARTRAAETKRPHHE